LKEQGATINVWGVGTKLVTAYDQPALGGVYKIAAIKNEHNEWDYKVKLSEQAIKVSNPGILQVRRYKENGEFRADMIYNEGKPFAGLPTMIDQIDVTRQKTLGGEGWESEDLLVPIFEKGKLVYNLPTLPAIKARVAEQLTLFHQGIKRFVNPHSYPVGLEKGLHDDKYDLIMKLRGKK
jgi:nicotinate phosphoribosyltransferase